MLKELNHLNVNGAELAYVEEGSGVPVVFVHGGFSDYRSWESQLTAVSANYRGISYSLRYHYPNKWGTEGSDYNISQHALDLASLIGQLEASPAHIVGTSYGARIALHLARDNPKHVRTLALAEPGLGAWLQQTSDGPALLSRLMTEFFSPGEKAINDGDIRLATRLFVTGVSGLGWFEKLPEDVLQRYMDNIRVQALPGSPVPFARDDARRITVPTLLLTGMASEGVFRRVVEELAMVLPNVERAEVPGSSHLMTVFNPVGFNEVLLRFLGTH